MIGFLQFFFESEGFKLSENFNLVWFNIVNISIKLLDKLVERTYLVRESVPSINVILSDLWPHHFLLWCRSPNLNRLPCSNLRNDLSDLNALSIKDLCLYLIEFEVFNFLFKLFLALNLVISKELKVIDFLLLAIISAIGHLLELLDPLEEIIWLLLELLPHLSSQLLDHVEDAWSPIVVGGHGLDELNLTFQICDSLIKCISSLFELLLLLHGFISIQLDLILKIFEHITCHFYFNYLLPTQMVNHLKITYSACGVLGLFSILDILSAISIYCLARYSMDFFKVSKL